MARNIEDAPMLVAQTGPLNGQRWNLQRNILIGRDESCDVIIPSRQVSRYHARLSIFPDGILLEDLASKNGTHCNGQPVAGSQDESYSFHQRNGSGQWEFRLPPAAYSWGQKASDARARGAPGHLAG